jgi:hypothetical protein
MSEGEIKHITVDLGGGKQEMRPVLLPSNSHKSRAENQEPKKVEKVISGTAKTRKRIGSGDGIIAESLHSVAAYLVEDVLLPAFKGLVSDVVSQGVDRLLYGEGSRKSTRPGYTNYSKASASAAARTAPATEYRTISGRSRARHQFDEIVLPSRGEAEDVLDQLRELADKYEQATVNDLYDLVGLTGSFADDKWGWYFQDLKHAGVKPIRGGYLLQLPRTQELD